MFDSKSVKWNYIAKKLKYYSELYNIWPWDIAEKMRVAQPTISNYLNSRKLCSDDYYIKIWKVIWLSDKELDNIIFEWEQEALKYKYPDKYKEKEKCDEDYEDEFKKVVFSLEKNLTETDKEEIMNFIKFKANK